MNETIRKSTVIQKYLMAVALMICVLGTVLFTGITAFAADGTEAVTYTYRLTSEQETAAVGNVVSARLTLEQNTAAESFPMYAVSLRIRYNTEALSLDKEAVNKLSGVTISYIPLEGNNTGQEDIVINAVSYAAEGKTWFNPAILADFSFTILKTGKPELEIISAEVSSKSGMYSLPVTTENLSWNAVQFQDVSNPGRYYYTPVYWALEKGITTGIAPDYTTFAPENPCLREQVVTFLWRSEGEPAPDTMADFTDVGPAGYYVSPVSWAAENKITTGYNDGTHRFGIGDSCTREQFVTFLWRIDGRPESTYMAGFRDVKANSYYAEAVAWAAEHDITKGISETAFGVGKNVTRAQVVTFLYRYAEYKDKQEGR